MNQFIDSFYQKHFQKIYNHAFLLVGPPLCGKFFIAKEIAKKLQNDTELKSNNNIIVDQLYQKGKLEDEEILSKSSNINQTNRKKKGTSTDIITIDDITTIINEINNRLSFDNSYKIVLINNIHRLNNEASNKILKTLEEPPNNCLFIFTTNNLFQVLETIKSRLTLLTIPQTSTTKIISFLEKNNNSPEKISLITKLANGFLYKAQKLNQEPELLTNYQTIDNLITKTWQTKKVAICWGKLNEFSKEEWDIFWDILSLHAYKQNDFVLLKKIENYFNLVLRGKANQNLLACDLILDICY